MRPSLRSSSGIRAIASIMLLAASPLAVPAPYAAESANYGSSSPTAGPLYDTVTGSTIQDIANNELVRRVYEKRGYQPIWTGSATAQSDTKRALDALRDAQDEGLSPEDYRFSQLSTMTVASASEQTTFEMLMTDSLLSYARDLRSGRVQPTDVDEDVALPALGFDFATALANAASSGTIDTFLAELSPKHAEYRHLKLALAHYRTIEAAGGWPTLPETIVSAWQENDSDLLHRRLAVEDDIGGANGESLTDALKRYQQRNGLAADGRLGPRTLAALNTPVAARIEQIVANMERWRWMPRDLEPRRIAVNVADATLRFIDGDATLLESNVVVGAPKWRTPILRAEVTAVTVNPVWHVPSSIARREIWPKQQANPSYLQSQGFTVVDGQIRQPPGAGNALGQLKLEMPNEFNVYLHDTPSKAAFQRETRTLSHGCVRVEQIGALGALAIGGDTQSSLDQLSQLIADGTTTRIDLNERIPVYLMYWTTIASDDGSVAFRNDVYDRDVALIAALKGNSSTPREVADLDV